MKTVIVGFSRPVSPTLFSKAIMWSDKTQYDHAYVKWNWSQIDRDIIYQASSLAVNFESNLTFASHSIPVEEYEFQLEDNVHSQFMQFCMDNSNKPYGVLEIVGFAYLKILKMMGITVGNPFPSNGNSYFCSQIVVLLLQLSDEVQLLENSADVDPLALNQMINAKGMKRIL